MPRPTFAEIDLGAVRHNLRALRGLLAPGVRLMGVIKADAYGHGAVPVARTLEAAGVDMLGVALVEEGVELRAAGVRAPILVMGGLPEDEIPHLLEHDLRPTVTDVGTIGALAALAPKSGPRIAAHLNIDTGMNRLGIRAADAARAVEALRASGRVRLEGVYTHFASADAPDPATTESQLADFSHALLKLKAQGLAPPVVHAANSSALVTLPVSHFDMVRPGLALYGVSPCDAARTRVDLVPALTLKTRVTHLAHVPRGEGISYGHTWRAPRDALIGTLPVGYGDGYPRALSNRGRVRAGAHLCPVVGTVCMDATLVDLTDVPGTKVGMEVALIEADNDSPLGARAIAESTGTISYEILTGLSKRVPRLYREPDDAQSAPAAAGAPASVSPPPRA